MNILGNRYTLALSLGLSIFAMQLSIASATPVLDQIYFDPVANLFAPTSVPDNSSRRAQTFTVGLAGLLNSVDIMTQVPGASMRILSTSSGVPTFTVLASSTIHQQTADGWTIWDLSSSRLTITPGQVLAMDMLSGGLWIGHAPGGYTGGASYFLSVSTGFPNFTPDFGDFDLFFRTFVGEGSRISGIPEPSALWLLLAGVLVLIRLKFAKE